MGRIVADDTLLKVLGLTIDELYDLDLRTLSNLAYDKGLDIDFDMSPAPKDRGETLVVSQPVETIMLEADLVGPAGNNVHYREYFAAKVTRQVVLAAECRTVLLVHGLLASGDQFHHTAQQLARDGYRVLVPDLRGHGRSGIPLRGYEKDGFTIAAIAEDLVAVLDHAKADKAHWVGNSLGGILGLMLAGGGRKERIYTLTTFGTAFALNLPTLTPQFFDRLFKLFGKERLAGIAAWFTSKDIYVRRVVRRMIIQSDPRAAGKIVNSVHRYDLTASARTYGGRILILRGSHDHAVNRVLDKQLQSLQDEGVVDRADVLFAGHCANLDSPDRFIDALLDFWEDLPPGGDPGVL